MKKVMLSVAMSIMLMACGEHKRPAYVPDLHDGTATIPPPGKGLFMGSCAACHNLVKDATGPALNGVVGRWGNDTTKLIAFIRNSQKVIKKDGPGSYAGKLYEQWSKTPMPEYERLNDTDIKQIILYINKGQGCYSAL